MKYRKTNECLEAFPVIKVIKDFCFQNIPRHSRHPSTPYQRNISAKIQKNIQKSDFMDEFCLQGELDLTLFYMIEGCRDVLSAWGYFENRNP